MDQTPEMNKPQRVRGHGCLVTDWRVAFHNSEIVAAMNTAVFLVLLGFLVAVMVATVVYGFRQAQRQTRKRTEDLQAVALQIGFTFQGEDWSQLPKLDTKLFSQGSYREFQNIMTGEWSGLKVNLFDYSYLVSSGKSSCTYTQTVAVFTQERWLPLFELRPEGFFDKVGDVFTHEDIDFDSNPEFSRRYLLRGEVSEKVRALFTPALVAYFEELAPEEWHVEGNGGALVIYHAAVKVGPEEIVSFRERTSVMAQTFLKSCGATV